MSVLVNINGELVPAEGPVIGLDNRAFHFGDGLFETIRVIDGKPVFLDAHWARLVSGAEVLRITMPPGLDQEKLSAMIVDLMQRNGFAHARCRLTLFRGGGGFYRPEMNEGRFTIEVKQIAQGNYELNEQGLMVDIWPEIRKPLNDLSRYKTLNCQYYVLASLWSQQRGLDDCLLQNDRGNIIESSCGNLFIVSNGVLYTPSLSDGCVGGVMRAQVINIALANGIKVYECSLNPQNLLAADELFLTNAALGIQWASTYRTKRYMHKLSASLVEMLVSSVA